MMTRVGLEILTRGRAASRSVVPASLLVIALLTVLSFSAAAADRTANPAAATGLRPLAGVEVFAADTVDRDQALAEDVVRARDGEPPRFAIPQQTFIAPDTHGTWEVLSESTRLWRLRISSPGALSLNLGFTRFVMPETGRLLIYPADGSQPAIAFTAADNRDHGQLWTPIVPGDELVVEVQIAAKAAADLELELTSVNVGYKTFGETLVDKSGTCNIDVVCPQGDGWRDDIQSVAVISTGGSTFCSGFMVNNTAQDERSFFMTAYHCGIHTTQAPSLVTYWNFFSPNCGQQGGGSLSQFLTGSTFRAESSTSDFTLVELNSVPDVSWNVSYAGWDRGTQDPTSATAIHHPSTDEKSISFEYDPLTTTTYLQTAIPGDGTHLRVTDWDVGTTEGGSSGSPLFDQNHRVVGQLHGGYADCTNNSSDWYGRFSRSWTGGGTSTTRLSNWLDPLNTGAQTLDLLAPYASGLRVAPAGGLTTQGDVGGPFTPASKDYTLSNAGDAVIGYLVAADVAWVSVGNASGTIPAGGDVVVTVSVNAAANSLATGIHTGTLSFTNTTDHDGDTTAPLTLQAGLPELVHGFDMTTNPGWTVEGQWAWGMPSGLGGAYGEADPTGGWNGGAVYGYNLAGDYANSLPERHLTTTALDCSGLSAVTLKFRRWLNVEQPAYDHAYVRVSNDGVNWTTVWQNTSEITDAAWSLVEYDISAVADEMPTVYVRWTMGATDSSWQYSGWNIDEVEIWGLQRSQGTGADDLPRAGQATLLGATPNPFNPRTEIRFDLPAAGAARLAVYDMRGHLVKILSDGELPAGEHVAVWDGTDDQGRALSSGGYVFRLEAGDVVSTRKGLLVR
ncbi:MAG: hypothetical protein C0395_04195 [Gemmatimonas sp.]|nr:hypothetical protein [Gemmatimonas sp.]